MKRQICILLITVAVIAGCTPRVVIPRNGMPDEYTSAWLEQYGRCYDSVPCSVVALDLYSEGLELDADHKMQGTGYNLYISDIFLPADTNGLVSGTYKSDTTAAPGTFLPGRDWEGTPSGMYLLYIEEGKLQSVQVLDSGMFVVRDTTIGLTDLQFTLYFRSNYGNRVIYHTRFQGKIQPWKKR